MGITYVALLGVEVKLKELCRSVTNKQIRCSKCSHTISSKNECIFHDWYNHRTETITDPLSGNSYSVEIDHDDNSMFIVFFDSEQSETIDFQKLEQMRTFVREYIGEREIKLKAIQC